MKGTPCIFNACQWSQDNQIALCTPEIIHILTPTTDKNPAKTLITLDRSRKHRFGTEFMHSESLYAPTELLMDCFLCCTWSPTKVSGAPFYGCLLATLTTHHYVEIYGPSEDPISDEWVLLAEVSKHYPIVANDIESFNALSFISLSWSQKCNDSSFIAVGSKSGTVSIFKFKENDTVHVLDVQVASKDTWVTQLSWSNSWENNKTYLAMSCSDGSLYIYLLEFDGESLNCFAQGTESICPPNRIPISCLSWFHSCQLAITKGNQLFIVKLSSSSFSPTKVDSLLVTSHMGAASIIWDYKGYELRIYSMDGYCFLLSLSPDSYLSVVDDTQNLQSTLFQDVQTHVSSPEEEDQDQAEGSSSFMSDRKLIIFGASTSAHSLFDCVLYSSFNPRDMHFKPPSLESCEFVLRKMVNESDDELIPDILHNVQVDASHLNPDYIGWDILKLDSNSLVHVESLLNSKLNSTDADKTTRIHQFLYYLTGKRHGNNNIHMQTQFDSYAHYLLQILYSIAIKNDPPLLESEFKTILFVSELCIKQQVSLESHNLKDILFKIHTHLNQQEYSRNFLNWMESHVPFTVKLEQCPACKQVMSMDSILHAQCSNGHLWDRCIFSLQVISSPFSRVCMGCGKKACLHLDGIMGQMKNCMYCLGHFKLA